MRKRIKTAAAVFFALALFCSGLCFPAFANSAQLHWRGTDFSGAVIIEENCPLTVTKELLSFEINEFPENHYSDADKFLSYSGKVSAEYSFYNPSDYNVSATLAFPYGTLPDYAPYFINDKTSAETNADSEKYSVIINGEKAEKELRFTFFPAFETFKPQEEIKKLRDGFCEDDFYSPELNVTKYSYTLSGIDDEQLAYLMLNISSADTGRKYFSGQTSDYSVYQDNVQIGVSVGNGSSFDVFVLGEKPSEAPRFTAYENRADKKELSCSISLSAQQSMSFKDFAFTDYNSESGISESDWYNAFVDSLKYREQGNVYFNEGNVFSLTETLMRWYTYEITVPAGASLENKVEAPIYPSLNERYEPAVYDYTYLLSPAKLWSGFDTLDIVINTPFYLLESGIKGFQKNENGYTVSLSELPDGELTFRLSTDENPSPSVNYNIYGLLMLVALIICLIFIIVLIIAIVRKKKKKP